MILLMSSVAVIAGVLPLFPQAENELKITANIGQRSGSCNEHLEAAESEFSSLQRAFAIRALHNCPTTPHIRNFLESMVLSKNLTLRKAALESLSGHHSKESIPFLLKANAETSLSIQENELVYTYLSKLAEPQNKNNLRLLFLQGLHLQAEGIGSSNTPANLELRDKPVKNILQHSLVGLGKLGSIADWHEIKFFFEHPDMDVQAAALQGSTLLAMQYQDAGDITNSIKLFLSHRDPILQRAAIQFVAQLNDEAALKDLVFHYFEGWHPENMPLLYTLIQKKIAQNSPTNTQFGITTKRTCIYPTPGESSKPSEIIAASEVISVKQTVFHKDGILPRAANQQHNRDSWHQVTFRGTEGWINGGDLRVIYFRPVTNPNF